MRFLFLKDSRGMSLVQVLVAVALLGIVTAGFATMFSGLANQQRLVQSRTDLISLTHEVQTMFSNTAACESSLIPGTPLDPARAAVAFPPPVGTAFQNNGAPFRMRINQETLEDGASLRSYALNVNRVQLVNGGTVGVDIAGRTIYKATVIGQFSPRGINGQGLSDFATRSLVTGYFTVNGGMIISCSLESPQDLAKIAENCVALGGTYDSVAKKCLLKPDPNDPELLASLCSKMGGTMTGGACKLPSSGGGGGVPQIAHWVRQRSLSFQEILQSNSFSKCPGVGSPSGTTCSPEGSQCKYTFQNVAVGGNSTSVDIYRCQ